MTGNELDGKDRKSMLSAVCCCKIYKHNKEGKVIKVFILSIGCRSKYPKDLNGRKYYEFKEGSTTIYIPVIRMWWGCYAKDTRFKLADGSYKIAAEIKPGSKLSGYGNEILVVDNGYKSNEQTLISIQTDAGHQLQVTKNHPILKEHEQVVTAAEVKVDDRILAENGTIAVVTKVEYISYDDQVYNFTFENHFQGTFFAANGLYAGDLYAQNQIERKSEPTDLQKQIAAEMKTLTQWRKRQKANANA